MVESMKKIAVSLGALVLLLTCTFTTIGAYSTEQIRSTANDKKSWLKSGNVYVEYDFGTWLPNDDAWLKAEVYGGSGKYSYCYAKYSGGTATSKGSSSNNYYAIAEVSGIDKFNSGSYADAHNTSTHLRLNVK